MSIREDMERVLVQGMARTGVKVRAARRMPDMEGTEGHGLAVPRPMVPTMNLSHMAAVEVITRKNADILGIGKMLGTLEKKKWASFIGWSGDPFDLASYPAAVYGEGQLLHSE